MFISTKIYTYYATVKIQLQVHSAEDLFKIFTSLPFSIVSNIIKTSQVFGKKKKHQSLNKSYFFRCNLLIIFISIKEIKKSIVFCPFIYEKSIKKILCLVFNNNIEKSYFHFSFQFLKSVYESLYQLQNGQGEQNRMESQLLHKSCGKSKNCLSYSAILRLP